MTGALLGAVSLAGCLSPTLPLPPPEAPLGVEDTGTPASGGSNETVWVVRGACLPGSLVLVENEATGKVFGIEDLDADGRYAFTIEAVRCDIASVWQIAGDVQSGRTSFLMAPTQNGVVDESECVGP